MQSQSCSFLSAFYAFASFEHFLHLLPLSIALPQVKGLVQKLLHGRLYPVSIVCHPFQCALFRQQRYDPKAVISDIPDAEVRRGLYELLMRGILPKSLDATPAFEGDVLALAGMLLFSVCCFACISLAYCRLRSFGAAVDGCSWKRCMRSNAPHTHS